MNKSVVDGYDIYTAIDSPLTARQFVKLFQGQGLGPIADRMGIASKGVDKRILKGRIINKLLELGVPEPLRIKISTRPGAIRPMTNSLSGMANQEKPQNQNQNQNVNRNQSQAPTLNQNQNLNKNLKLGNGEHINGVNELNFTKTGQPVYVNANKKTGASKGLSFQKTSGVRPNVNTFRLPNFNTAAVRTAFGPKKNSKFSSFRLNFNTNPRKRNALASLDNLMLDANEPALFKNINAPGNLKNQVNMSPAAQVRQVEQQIALGIPVPPPVNEARRTVVQTAQAAGPNSPATLVSLENLRKVENKNRTVLGVPVSQVRNQIETIMLKQNATPEQIKQVVSAPNPEQKFKNWTLTTNRAKELFNKFKYRISQLGARKPLQTNGAFKNLAALNTYIRAGHGANNKSLTESARELVKARMEYLESQKGLPNGVKTILNKRNLMSKSELVNGTNLASKLKNINGLLEYANTLTNGVNRAVVIAEALKGITNSKKFDELKEKYPKLAQIINNAKKRVGEGEQRVNESINLQMQERNSRMNNRILTALEQELKSKGLNTNSEIKTIMKELDHGTKANVINKRIRETIQARIKNLKNTINGATKFENLRDINNNANKFGLSNSLQERRRQITNLSTSENKQRAASIQAVKNAITSATTLNQLNNIGINAYPQNVQNSLKKNIEARRTKLRIANSKTVKNLETLEELAKTYGLTKEFNNKREEFNTITNMVNLPRGASPNEGITNGRINIVKGKANERALLEQDIKTFIKKYPRSGLKLNFTNKSPLFRLQEIKVIMEKYEKNIRENKNAANLIEYKKVLNNTTPPPMAISRGMLFGGRASESAPIPNLNKPKPTVEEILKNWRGAMGPDARITTLENLKKIVSHARNKNLLNKFNTINSARKNNLFKQYLTEAPAPAPNNFILPNELPPNESNNNKRRRQAATKIQASARGFLLRKAVRNQRAANVKEAQALELPKISLENWEKLINNELSGKHGHLNKNKLRSNLVKLYKDDGSFNKKNITNFISKHLNIYTKTSIPGQVGAKEQFNVNVKRFRNLRNIQPPLKGLQLTKLLKTKGELRKRRTALKLNSNKSYDNLGK